MHRVERKNIKKVDLNSFLAATITKYVAGVVMDLIFKLVWSLGDTLLFTRLWIIISQIARQRPQGWVSYWYFCRVLIRCIPCYDLAFLVIENNRTHTIPFMEKKPVDSAVEMLLYLLIMIYGMLIIYEFMRFIKMCLGQIRSELR